MAAKLKNGKATLYWDRKELEGGPFFVDKITRGFVGVYTNFVGGLGDAATKVDGLIIKIE
ncbi:MAG: hypothetical protein OEZ31_11025 [Nitrospirota bacterium]|nr:hypothetical protein [Nitrospirota bacterium]MDH5769466.1 hypothetical protein [Nitrospirota bacterium]